MAISLGRYKNWLLPVIVVGGAYAVALVIRAGGPEVEIIAPEPQATVVRVVSAQPETVQLTVESQGEAGAEHSIDLTSELAGKVLKVSPGFVSGGYFTTGDVLVQIDPTDYRLAKIRAAAAVAEAEEELSIEKSEARLAAEGLFPMMEAKVASAEARVQSARAELAQAEADLERTLIRAPFDGRVLFTQVDPGQYISKGASMARIFSTGRAEIRLPLTDQQLQFLDNPFGTGRDGGRLNTPVTFRAAVGGRPAEWQGYLDRMDGAVDDDNRVWYAVAYVDDPYNIEGSHAAAPLVVGLFVEAEITGRRIADVYRLPRSALRNENQILVVDADNRLRQRQVDVLRTDFAAVYVAGGITPGERICVSPIDTFVDGLLVEAIETTGALAALTETGS
ncbi:MAG: efflux RND transporter periplasmic adaptor subunit [Gammaproteobacteria bacterium]|jgi:RND family efflux transporter MFP subunit|nr:efflux RND transporter periplasmic adaptor subunit [Gammaproteobacteria bacterium]